MQELYVSSNSLRILDLLTTEIVKAASRNEHFKRYQGNWAIIEIMKTALKNKRNYRKKVGRSICAQPKVPVDEEDEELDNPRADIDQAGAVPGIDDDEEPESDGHVGEDNRDEEEHRAGNSEGEGEGSNDEPEETNENGAGTEESSRKKRKANSQMGANAKKAKASA